MDIISKIKSSIENTPTNNTAKPRLAGDISLTPDPIPDNLKLKPAAILLPLIIRENNLHVLLTQRSKNLSQHRGQICFPGGKLEKTDKNHAATALRETHEETGIPPEDITIIGNLQPFITRTGFEIFPYIGTLLPPKKLKPEINEVDKIFEAPLDFFLNPANRQIKNMSFGNQEREFYFFQYKNYHIWGATAGIMVNFLNLINGDTTK